MNPKHISEVPEFIEVPKKDGTKEKIKRRAFAPYNFVELPNKVVEAEELPIGDRYHIDKHTGRIHCILTTESPLYLRCGMTPDDFSKYSEFFKKEPPKNMTKEEKQQWEKEEKERKESWEKKRKELLAPFFTYSSDGLPVLPGSSLRGMLRNLVEIVSFSKIERVSGHERLFFRAVASNPDKASWGNEYKTYVDPKEIQAGYLKKDEQGWYIQPAKTEHSATFAWVRETSLSLTNLKKFNDDKYEPQYISVSYGTVALDNTDRAKRLFAHNVELPDIHQKKGVLVTSGNMKQGNEPSPRRNHCVVFECLVFEANSTSSKLRLNDKAIEHYRNALTNFQKGAPFNQDWGVIEENRPVFYRPPKNGSKIVGFFGQSPNFRIPYSPQGDGHATTVVDFIPEKLRKLATIDLADAIFGWVKKESEEEKLPEGFDKQRAGRVFVTDALYKSSQKGIRYEDEPFSPQVLSEPKPTCFSHYLVQPEENNPNADPLKLKHYASQSVTETVIRGHKLYWHKGSDPKFKLAPPKKVIGSTKKVSDTQTTLITPINRGVVFTFDIHFENLSKVELGALLYVLSLSNEKSQKLETGKSGEKYCFSLGMGKPLGMGAVKIDYNLHLIKRNKRYSKLFNNEQWKTGEEDQSQTIREEGESVKAFEKYVFDRICFQDYPINKSREQLQHLKELPRIEMLLAMLQCHEIIDVDKTRYMRIEPKPSEYAERPVLPTPLDISGIPDNRRFPDINTSSGGTGENKSIDNPKKKVISSKPKPKPKNESNPDRGKGGDNTNRATQRAPKPKN